MNIQAVFFDLDETLFDRKQAQYQVMDLMIQALPDLFQGIDHNKVLSAFTESHERTVQEYQAGLALKKFRMRRSSIFLDLLNLPQSRAIDITDVYTQKYPLVKTPVSGAKKVLEHLSGKYRLGVITNGFPDMQYRKLDTLELRPFFDCIVVSDELGIEKPDPAIFQHAASLVQAPVDACIHVGDSFENDVIGAKNANMRSCWFNPQQQKPPQTDIQPDFEIRSLEDVFTCLMNCFF